MLERSIAATTLSALLLTSVAGCGYSEDEMQAKIHQIDELKTQLSAEQERNKEIQGGDRRAARQDRAAQAAAQGAGVDISNLNANLEQQARALEDYKRRADQLEAIKRRFELLRDKLQALTKLGLKVTVRNNRMVIELPGDVLFDSGRETLKKDGEQILLKVADVIRNDAGLSSRNFQVAGHTDNAPLAGGRYRTTGASASCARARCSRS